MSNKYFIYGIHAVEVILKNHPERVLRVYAQQGIQNKSITAFVKLAKEADIAIESITRAQLDRMTEGGNHQGIAVMCALAAGLSEKELSGFLQQLTTPPFILILDGVQDPHNLGACFRSAEAAGVQLIIAPKDNAVGMTPVVSKVASGAAEIVPYMQVTNLVRVLEELKNLGIWIYGAAAETDNTIYQTDLTGPLAIVLGAEGKGLRRLTKDHCDGLMKIPMQGSVASLNVSVAAGICLFEALRQRKQK